MIYFVKEILVVIRVTHCTRSCTRNLYK